GNIEVTVLTTTASDWQFAVSVCGATPDARCASSASGRGRLQLRSTAQLKWWWTGAMIAPPDLGSPISASSYTMCLYAQGALKMTATAAAGGTCGTKPCWKSSSGGFKYADKN